MTDGFLGMFNVEEEIERFQPDDTASGRRAETLIKTESLRVVLAPCERESRRPSTRRRVRSPSMRSTGDFT